MKIVNRFGVDPETWNNFSAGGKLRYNNLFGKMINNQLDFIHPKAFMMPYVQWHTICHNAAYVAAKQAFDAKMKVERGEMQTQKIIDKLIYLGISEQ